MIKKWFTRFLMIITGFLFILILSFFIADSLFPLSRPEIQPSPVVVDRHHRVLRHFANQEGIFRHWVALDEVSPQYLSALIAYEDRYFYHHFGINPLATLRASFQWLLHRKVISGSSTLTMQVARLLNPHERTLAGKFTQMFRAIQLERMLSKDEILTLYLNLAPMGGNIEGVQTASWRYFSKNASELNLAESALLVALPQKPSYYRPDLYPEHALNARNKVLDRLASFKMVSQAQISIIKKDPLGYQPEPTAFHAPIISEKLYQLQPEKNEIVTTIDKVLQQSLEIFIKNAAKKWPAHISGAILVVDNHQHEVHAYLGSTDFFDTERFGYVDMIQAIRSPGSTLKPFAYGMAMDYGIIHEASLLTDVRRNFSGYAPKNFDGHFRGAVPMFEALQLSLNVPVVQVLTHLTPYRFIKTIRDANIRILVQEPNLSTVLGGVGITLFEQVRLYSSMATQGNVYPLTLTPGLKEPSTGTIMSQEASWVIYKILSDMHPPHTFNIRKLAWKTGTSYGYRDAWAIGVSNDWTVGIWIGRPDGVPNVGTLANQYALPMLFDVFTFLPKDKTALEKPVGIIQEEICWPDGRKHNIHTENTCERTYTIEAISGKIPPTLYDSEGETAHNNWPKALKDNTEVVQQTRIVTLTNHSIIFKSSLKMLLEAQGNPPFRWYLNGKLLQDNELNIATLPLGHGRLSVFDRFDKSDSIEFEVRDY